MAVHTRLGFATFSEYVERRLGYDSRTTAEKLRVADALQDLPLMQDAVRTGQRPWTAVRELVRVVVPDTEAAWLAASEHKSVREIERMVSGHRVGDGPDDPKDPALKTYVVRLELTAELYARYRDAVDRMRKEVDGSLTDEQALGAMVDRALGGPADEGRAPYQVSVTTCDHCGRTWQVSRGELIQVDASVGERAGCDGQIIGRVPAPDATHVGELPTPATHVGQARAYQTVTPRLRRAVLSRAHGRCEVPGCGNTQYLDVHHLVRRADDGKNDEETCGLLCSTHHRLLHKGLLVILGTRSTGLRFFHADGTLYGAPPPPSTSRAEGEPSPTSAHLREAQAALRSLGIDAAAARGLIAEALSDVGPTASADDIVRSALRARGRALATRHAPEPAATAAHDAPISHVGSYARALSRHAVPPVTCEHARYAA